MNQPNQTLGYLRCQQILKDYLPIGRSTFLERVKNGTYPQPIKISPRITVWRRADIEALCQQLGGQNGH